MALGQNAPWPSLRQQKTPPGSSWRKGLLLTPIFILGAPRTGSTVLFQTIVGRFELPYISNFTNHYFSKNPLLGLAVQRLTKTSITLESAYGKTSGRLQPSEGSAIFNNWFGGNHPSQKYSYKIAEGKEEHFLKTVSRIQKLYGNRPLVTKNAWNCFRVPYLAQALPKAKFIWIRRDIFQAAESDLEARYTTKDSPVSWNSATPANFKELLALRPSEQVVENQYEFSKAISSELSKLEASRSMQIWYEDLIADTDTEVLRISQFLSLTPNKKYLSLSKTATNGTKTSDQEVKEIHLYLQANPKFDWLHYQRET